MADQTPSFRRLEWWFSKPLPEAEKIFEEKLSAFALLQRQLEIGRQYRSEKAELLSMMDEIEKLRRSMKPNKKDLKTSLYSKYGDKKAIENELWDDKMTSQLRDRNTVFRTKRAASFTSLDILKKKCTSLFATHTLIGKDRFGGKDTKYEHSGETWSAICKRKIVVVDDMQHDIGLFYTKTGEEHGANVDCDGKMTSQLQDRFTGGNLNKYEETLSNDNRKKTVQHLLPCLITTIVFLWIIFDTWTNSSIIQLHGLLFIWSSLLEPFCFIVFIWAIVATIVVDAPFSRMQSALLMFWAILMLVRSAKSITEVYVPILGILFTGCCVLVEKQSEPPN